ncbi:polysaccharide pyruvyl transferase family protein [Enterococcus gilvus]|uniref:polysaccharide pyruvyl transferase family protein n=1 Tax=Enterococcus gilvus TaxID=160453 RepID=UPI0028D440C1|nr:polysaccharide pyruvyl transferase family protein [Enterococcus gilvus]
MKKIAILTLPGNFNYGNRLQNYALQTILEEKGYHTETLNIEFSRKNNIQKICNAIVRCLKTPSLIKMFFRKREYGNSFTQMTKLKSPKLQPFTENNLKIRTVEKEDLYTIESQYDFFIVGSDQVWNQSAISDNTFFLDFVPYEKRYSYAASFGKSEILNADKRYFKKNIESMKKISVREFAGKEIVHNLTGRDACVHVDPTMLLTSCEWRKLAQQEDTGWLPRKKFILIYTLRGMDKAIKKELVEIAEKNSYEIISIMGDSIDENSRILSVIQFIQAIDRAELVITDSFHGTVFSIILNTPFQVLERKTGNMNSRIDTLLDKFNLSKNSNKINTSLEEILITDFSGVESILLRERKKSMKYFDSFLIDSVTSNE